MFKEVTVFKVIKFLKERWKARCVGHRAGVPAELPFFVSFSIANNKRSLGHQPYVSVGLLGGREQGNLRKCSPSALESALRNRGALGSAPESALEVALPVFLHSEKTLESTLGSTPESTPISESTLESTRGALSEISLFSAP